MPSRRPKLPPRHAHTASCGWDDTCPWTERHPEPEATIALQEHARTVHYDHCDACPYLGCTGCLYRGGVAACGQSETSVAQGDRMAAAPEGTGNAHPEPDPKTQPLLHQEESRG